MGKAGLCPASQNSLVTGTPRLSGREAGAFDCALVGPSTFPPEMKAGGKQPLTWLIVDISLAAAVVDQFLFPAYRRPKVRF